MNLNQIRQEIPALQKCIYMNTGWSGPSPTRVLKRIRQTLEQEATDGPATPKHLMVQQEIFAAAHKAVATFLNADVEEIAITHSTTDGLNIVVNGLPWKHGDQVVTFNLEHPSVLMPLFFLQERYGVRLRVIELSTQESPEGILAKVQEALSLDTRLVALSHIQYSCGLLMPVEQISVLAKGRGIHLLVDGAQAVGQIPVDLHDLGCDFYALPGQKWLLGPEGIGALYIRKELIPKVAPAAVSSSAVTQWDHAGNYQPQESSIRKFHLTTHNAALAAGLVEAINFIEEVGVPEIRQRTLVLASQLKEALAQIDGCTVLGAMEGQSTSSGLISFTLRDWSPKEVVTQLWERWLIAGRAVSHPPNVRLSTAFFNTEREVHRAVTGILQLSQETPPS